MMRWPRRLRGWVPLGIVLVIGLGTMADALRQFEAAKTRLDDWADLPAPTITVWTCEARSLAVALRDPLDASAVLEVWAVNGKREDRWTRRFDSTPADVQVLDLQPQTTYALRAWFARPDGSQAEATRMATTRPEVPESAMRLLRGE